MSQPPPDLDQSDAKPGKIRSVWNEWLRASDPVAAALAPDEPVVWRAMGAGFDHRPYLALLYGVVAVIAIAWTWPRMPVEQIRLPELQPIGSVLFFILVLGAAYQRGGYAKRSRCFYTLTDRRLFIYVVGQQTPPVSLARVDGALGQAITGISLETRVSASDMAIHVAGSSAPCILYGVDEPWKIANLIKSTLGLDIEIQAPPP